MDVSSKDSAYEPDEIDYFLSLEEAQANAIGAKGNPPAGTVWASLSGLCISGSLLALRYYSSFLLKRISYLLCIKQELKNDRQWPRSNEKKEPLTATPVSSVQVVVSHLYRSEGVRGFFRGARLSVALAVLTNVESVALMSLLRHLTKVVPTPSFYDDPSAFLESTGLAQVLDPKTLARAFWWVVMPTIVWAAQWPLRSLRTILLTTYMANGAIIVEEDTRSDNNKIGGETQADKNHEGKNKSHCKVESRHQPVGLGLTYTQLWRRVRTGCSWWDIIRNGWEVDLTDHATGIILNKFTKACVALALMAEKVSPALAPWLSLSPETTYVVLRISLSVMVTVAVTTVRQPTLVVSRRMALLLPPRRNSETHPAHENIRGDAANGLVKGEECPSRRSVLRYRNAWACVSYILHNEGWRALFDGVSFNLIIQIALLGFTFVRQRFMLF